MKKILLFAPNFYGYEYHIKKALINKGYEVILITNKIDKLRTFIYSLGSEKFRKDRYEKNLFKLIKKNGKGIDIFIVIKGEYLIPEHLKFIKDLNPNIKNIMYQWDSMKNHNYEGVINLFDAELTFDFEDAKRYNLNYLPLFYTNDITSFHNNEDIDFLLVGMFNPERYKYYLRLKEISSNNNLIFKSYIFCPLSHYITYELIRKKLNINSLKDIKFKSLSRSKLISLYKRAKIFIDVCSPNQTGMSMRTIEAYGMNKKLITGNYDNIKSDSLINDIDVLPCESSIENIISFVNKEPNNYKNKEKLSIDNWIAKLLSMVEPV